MSFPNKALIGWYEGVKRPMPWRETKDPYLVWVSEIILQQTRVDQGMPYYDRFITEFPTVQSLASATQDEVLKMWEGLGYYSRARNMHATAKHISIELQGKFPNEYKKLLELKGIGPYTAAAISSIVFELPNACVDGNVIRVISRYFGIEDPVDETETRKRIDALAHQVLNKRFPGEHNQAMMELGATCCLPQNPTCDACPLNKDCFAFRNDKQNELPVKLKKTKVRDRFFNYIVFSDGGFTAVEKRPSGDIWEGLHQFPMIESDSELSVYEALEKIKLTSEITIISVSEIFKHVLSHQRIFAKFIHVKVETRELTQYEMVKIDQIDRLAFPRLIGRYLEKQPFVIKEEV